MKLTLLSDTHNCHHNLKIPGGDIIIHSGDISNRGFDIEIENFCEWYKDLNYEYKIFIAGNHDFYFQDNPDKSKKILQKYNIIYLEDDFIYVGEYPNFIKIYGTPYQPTYYNWAFNLPRHGLELKEKWDNIPNDVDILITHTPPFGILDKINNLNVGCELLKDKIIDINPKIHVFGHIHKNGYYYNKKTHFFNASIINENFEQMNPINIEWDFKKNEILILN